MKSNKNDYNRPNFKGRRFVMSDVHGGYKAMLDALKNANFDYENDLLINLGDVVDGWSESKEVIDELLKIKNLIYLLGNHDEWSMKYYNGETSGDAIPIWFTQGGKSTIESLGKYAEQDHKYLEFFKSGLYYYTINDNDVELPKIFAHANIPSKGFDMEKLVASNKSYDFIWDRRLIQEAAHFRNSKKWVDNRFSEIYLGHSCVSNLMKFEEHGFKPQKMTNVIAMDTNAGYDGKVSLMDIDTKEIFQSDFVRKYYPNERGRNKYSYNEILND